MRRKVFVLLCIQAKLIIKTNDGNSQDSTNADAIISMNRNKNLPVMSGAHSTEELYTCTLMYKSESLAYYNVLQHV